MTREWGAASERRTAHPAEDILGEPEGGEVGPFADDEADARTEAPQESARPPGRPAAAPPLREERPGAPPRQQGPPAAGRQGPSAPGGQGAPRGQAASGGQSAPGPANQPPQQQSAGQATALAALSSLPRASTLVFDQDLRYVLVAGRAPGHHGLKPREIEGQPAQEVLGPDWWEIYGPLYRAALDGDTRSLEIWSNDGTRCYLAEVGPLFNAAKEITGGVAVFRDVTKRKRADEARFEAEERFELIFEQGTGGMALMTLEGSWLRVNQALAEITGYSSDSLMSKSLQELTYPDDRSNDIEDLRALLDGDIADYRAEKRLFHARGHIISIVLWVSVVRDRAGRPQHLIAQMQDITERKLMEERLHNLAEYDGLTGLRNRRLFEHELGLLVDRSKRATGQARRSGEGSALLIIDLDNFRAVNETAGHRTGDELLKAIAAGLQERLRGTDLIARLDGDEFGVLLRGTPLNAAEAVARGLRQVVTDCTSEVAGRQVGCTASVGVISIDAESESAEAVRMAAEQEMFAEKLARRRETEEEPGGNEELPGEANYE